MVVPYIIPEYSSIILSISIYSNYSIQKYQTTLKLTFSPGKARLLCKGKVNERSKSPLTATAKRTWSVANKSWTVAQRHLRRATPRPLASLGVPPLQ